MGLKDIGENMWVSEVYGTTYPHSRSVGHV